MLEMGITFSFKQLILDSAAIEDIMSVTDRIKMPAAINDSSFVKDLVSMYKGETPPNREDPRGFWQGAKNQMEAENRAMDLANEIINTHKGADIDRLTMNQMRRIVLSAE